MTLGVWALFSLHVSAKCLDYQAGQSSLESVQTYLTTQFWQETGGSYWQLEPNGTLYVWSEASQSYTAGSWTIAQGPLMPVLSVSVHEHVRRYTVLAKCDQLLLASLEGDTYDELSLQATTAPENALAAQLAGEWQSAYLGGYCRLEFVRGGQLLASQQSENGLQNRQGRWVLGRDGRTVFLHINGCSRVEIISIKYLELDEMVVRLVCDSLLVSPGVDYYFNKL